MGEFKERYGPVALVTGASSGIGVGFAEELASRGLDLVLAARRLDRMDLLKSRLEAAHGIAVRVVESDLSQARAPVELAAEVANLDVGLVISNAGFGAKGWFETIDPGFMADLLMVNCHAPMQLAHAFIPRLKARGKGGLVLTASVEGLMGGPFSAAYAASKALVIALGEGLWGELAGTGVDVLTLCPGATESEAAAKQGFDPAKMQNVMKARDVARLTLDNIANGPTFISSAHYKAVFDQLLSLPRSQAIMAMAAGMKPKG